MTEELNGIIKKLKTNQRTGLSTEEAKKRLNEEGPNRFREEQSQSMFTLIWAQLNNALIYILIGAAILSAIAGEISDAVIIGIVIAINTFVGVIQESKAEKALQELKQMATPTAIVRR